MFEVAEGTRVRHKLYGDAVVLDPMLGTGVAQVEYADGEVGKARKDLLTIVDTELDLAQALGFLRLTSTDGLPVLITEVKNVWQAREQEEPSFPVPGKAPSAGEVRVVTRVEASPDGSSFRVRETPEEVLALIALRGGLT